MQKTGWVLAGALTVAVALVASAPARAQAASDAERMNRIEAQMRNLTGQIELLTHTLSELQAQLKRMQDDNDFRFKSLESAAATPAAKGQAAPPTAKGQATPPPVATPPATAALPPASAASGTGSDAIGTIAAGEAAPQPQPGTVGPGSPPRPLGTLTLNAPAAGAATAPPNPANQPLDLTALARGGATDSPPLPQAIPPDQKAVAAIAPSGDPQADYKRAYDMFVGGQYAASEASFRQFLAAYPNDDRASDATYWLGQTLYSRGMYRQAALEFVNGHKLYPKSQRAADTMLLLGKSLAGIPEREAACQTFAAALKQYPQMAPTLRQRVVSEQANAGC